MTESNRADIIPISYIWSNSLQSHITCRRYACTQERVSWHRRQGRFMLSQIINPTFCRTGQADLSLWQSYHKSNIYQWFGFTRHKRSSGKLSMYLLTASHGRTQTISSVVLSNANAALSALTALRLGQFSNTAKLKEDEISNDTLALKCTITQSAPGQMWVIVFPALTLPGFSSVCYWCPGSFSITD